jgi:FixJ family two-component response regulator
MMVSPQADFMVYLVDDDSVVTESLKIFVQEQGFRARCFASAEEFLAAMPLPRPSCLLLDEQLPGMSGSQLLVTLADHSFDIPVVLISAFADRGMAVSALRQGALTVLSKPIANVDLVAALLEAQAKETQRLADRAEFERCAALFANLNPSELEVMRRIYAGEQNKAIAYDMGISLRTVELRRHNIFNKLAVDGVADLVKLKLRFSELRSRFGSSAAAKEPQSNPPSMTTIASGSYS